MVDFCRPGHSFVFRNLTCPTDPCNVEKLTDIKQISATFSYLHKIHEHEFPQSQWHKCCIIEGVLIYTHMYKHYISIL